MTPPTRFHLSLPQGGRGPGVLVLHEAWGLTDDIVWAADKLAGHGYVALAPDLVPAMRGMAGALAQLVVGRGPLITIAHQHVDHLMSRPEVDSTSVAVVGFSMGGALALMLDRHPGVSLLGCNYGMVPRMALETRDVPVVASFGGTDRLLPRGDGPIRRRLASSNLTHDIVVYPDAGHSFMTPLDVQVRARAKALGGIGEHEPSSGMAWDRLLGQMSRHLPATTG
jgi:carboxymethylenebutenolidase